MGSIEIGGDFSETPRPPVPAFSGFFESSGIRGVPERHRVVTLPSTSNSKVGQSRSWDAAACPLREPDDHPPAEYLNPKRADTLVDLLGDALAAGAPVERLRSAVGSVLEETTAATAAGMSSAPTTTTPAPSTRSQGRSKPAR